MPHAAIDSRIEEVRLFNRFYTRRIGILRRGLYETPFSLAETRVLYELATRQNTTATELRTELDLDPGYLSRILRGLKAQGLLNKVPAKGDARQRLLALTARGRAEFAVIKARSQQEIGTLLGALPDRDQERVVRAMRTILEALGNQPKRAATYVLRPHQPGDMGWVVERHGLLYSREYGYNEHFEALVARIVAEFLQRYDARRERCWVAEKDGERIGSVFLVAKSKKVAKLRLLLVEPEARGLGIGKRLVDECLRFARQAGYRKIVLWTQSELAAARRIYKQAGFRQVAKQKHRSFGPELTAETWQVAL